MRLIDADELKKDIMSYKTMPEIRKAICEVIDDAPTVEPEKVVVANVTFDKDKLEQIVRDRVIEPIKNGELVIKDERPHGKWIEVPVKRDILHPNGIKYVCSACKRDNCYGNPPFCMWCGATMKSETESVQNEQGEDYRNETE